MGISDELQKLEELRQSGALSLEEYNEAKAAALRTAAEGSQSNYQSDVRAKSKANSFKFDTVVWLIAGLLIPFWPISLPFCWYMAYRSYKRAR